MKIVGTVVTKKLFSPKTFFDKKKLKKKKKKNTENFFHQKIWEGFVKK